MPNLRAWRPAALFRASTCALLVAGTPAFATPPRAPAPAAVGRAGVAAVRPLRVPLIVRRFDPLGSRHVPVSNGIPLPPGALRDGEVGAVRVLVGGRDQRARVRALRGHHADGSLRSVLVQFEHDFVGDTIRQGMLEIGGEAVARSVPPAPATDAEGVPLGAALPSDPEYLVSTDLVGATRTAEATRALGVTFARWDRDFVRAADRQWDKVGDQWEHNYYDRALVWTAMWVRTGDSEYWRRAVRQAVAYRRAYLEKNDYGASPHWSQLEGLEKHYLLTGDETSRTAVGQTADRLWGVVARRGVTPWDQRIVGRILLAQLLAKRLEVGDAQRRRRPAAPEAWGARVDRMVGQLLAWQEPDGRYDTGNYWCHGQANYMVGLLNDALVKAHTYHRADPRIVTLVKRSSDYMWRTQWDARKQAFRYVTVPCEGRGGTGVAGDLTGLIVAPYGWLARVTGDPSYREQGDALFAGLQRHAFLGGSKQFNQAYTSSYLYLGQR